MSNQEKDLNSVSENIFHLLPRNWFQKYFQGGPYQHGFRLNAKKISPLLVLADSTTNYQIII